MLDTKLNRIVDYTIRGAVVFGVSAIFSLFSVSDPAIFAAKRISSWLSGAEGGGR
jgi:hypothetical protein